MAKKEPVSALLVLSLEWWLQELDKTHAHNYMNCNYTKCLKENIANAMRKYNRDPKLNLGVRTELPEKVTFKPKFEESVGVSQIKGTRAGGVYFKQRKPCVPKG